MATKAKRTTRAKNAPQRRRETSAHNADPLIGELQARAENLVGLALEMSSSLSLSDLVSSFASRAGKLFGARATAVGLCHEASSHGMVETVVLHDPALTDESASRRRLSEFLSAYAATRSDAIFVGSTDGLLEGSLKTQLDWRSVLICRLSGSSGDLLGFLCLADCAQQVTPDNVQLLQALAGHASIALENSRLFTRIAQSNRQWAELFDAISDFIVVHDEARRITRLNRPLAAFLGRRPQDLVGKPASSLLPDQEKASLQSCPFCFHDRDRAEFVYPGTSRTYLLSTSRIRAPLNDGFHTIHVLKDVTEGRDAERRYRELFDNVQEGVFFSTPAGRFHDVNDALVRMLGYDSREELLGLDIPTQFYATPDQREQLITHLRQRPGISREVTLRRKNGSIIYALEHSIVVLDENGQTAQYRGLLLDITETKNFQAQLQRQRDFNNQVLNNTQSMILVADTAGLISYANRRCYEATSLPTGSLVGRRLRDVFTGLDQPAWEAAFSAVLRGQAVDNLETQASTVNGVLKKFSVSLSPMRGDQESVNSIVVVMNDITEFAAIQAKLMHTEKMAAVGQLVSGVAHEVNNPLTAIMGFADLMLENPALPQQVQQDLRVILQEAQRTKEIVQNLLNFARQTPKQRRAVDLNALLKQTIALRSYDFNRSAVAIVQTFDSVLPEVIGDAHQLQQVFLNILNNAFDAVQETGRPGRIEVQTSRNGNSVLVSFQDNGPGIVQADRIFDPFFTTKAVGKGTGLGLSICYGIVRQHGGEIACFNNGTTPGATFVIRLPLTSYAAAVREQLAAGAQA